MLAGDRVVSMWTGSSVGKGGKGSAFVPLKPLTWWVWLWLLGTLGTGRCKHHLASLVQDLENQMHIAEQRRRTLLKDFHDT